MAKSKKSPFQSFSDAWKQNQNSIWLASGVRFHRNVEKFKFAHVLSSDKQKQILSLASSQLLNDQLIEKPIFFTAEDLSPNQKEFLYEHYLTPHSFQQTHADEGFIVNQSGTFLATINIHDHIRIQLMDWEGELENMWNTLMMIEMNLGNKINFSYSSRFGYLTPDPADAGTGLSVATFLHIPAAIHMNELEDFLVKHRDPSIQISGLHGHYEEHFGDVLVISNQYKLGLTEEDILSSVRLFTTKLEAYERTMRTKALEEESAELKDKVCRAFGVLMHSYQIEVPEALEAISLLKLGAALNWLSGVSESTLNNLFFKCRRGHLLMGQKDDFPIDQIPHKRSETIHDTLKKTKLLIG